MNLNKFKRVIYINEISFFFGWIIIFLLGADNPPPIGFIWLVLLVIFLDVIQYFYLKRFLTNLENKSEGLFIKNLFFSVLAGSGVSILTILSRLKMFLSIGFVNTLVWIVIITIVAILYGIYFYVINILLIKYIV